MSRTLVCDNIGGYIGPQPGQAVTRGEYICSKCWRTETFEDGRERWVTRVFSCEFQLLLHQIARHDAD